MKISIFVCLGLFSLLPFSAFTEVSEVDFNAWRKKWERPDKSYISQNELEANNKTQVMARVLKCLGDCRYFRGEAGVKAQYQSQLKEGDEIVTGKDSTLWMVLANGDLLKLAAMTSLNLQQVQLSRKRMFFLIRLNYGFSHYIPRLKGNFIAVNQYESDLSVLPLKTLKANREYYMIQQYRKNMNNADDFIERNPGHLQQYEALNRLRAENEQLKRGTPAEVYFYTPNLSLLLAKTQLSLFYEVNGASYFHLSDQIQNFIKDSQERATQEVFLRGFLNSKSYRSELNKWYKVDKKGSTLIESQEFYSSYLVEKAFVARIPSLQLAAELWLKKYEHSLIKKVEEEEQIERLEFIKEYVRRVETTNLESLANLYKGKRGEGFDSRYYTKNLQKHYEKLEKKLQLEYFEKNI